LGSELDSALDDCLAHLAAGAGLEESMAAYPRYRDALRPLLAAALMVAAAPLPEPRPEARQAGRARMLAALKSRGQTGAVPVGPAPRESFWARWSWTGPRLALRLAVVALVVVLVTANVALVASAAGSLPGDTLYPVKRTVESARLSLAFDERNREDMEEQFAMRRQQEVKAMQAQGRTGFVDLEGSLEPLEDGEWSLDGFPFRLNAQTAVSGELATGARGAARVEILGNGSVFAVSVRVGTRPVGTAGTPTPTPAPTTSAETPTREPAEAPAAAPTEPSSQAPAASSIEAPAGALPTLEPTGAVDEDAAAPASQATAGPEPTGPALAGETEAAPSPETGQAPVETGESGPAHEAPESKAATPQPEVKTSEAGDIPAATPWPEAESQDQQRAGPATTPEPAVTIRPGGDEAVGPGHGATPGPSGSGDHRTQPPLNEGTNSGGDARSDGKAQAQDGKQSSGGETHAAPDSHQTRHSD
jgi:hypothetical protein